MNPNLPPAEGESRVPTSGRWEALARKLAGVFRASQMGLLSGLALLLALRKALVEADIDVATADFLARLAGGPIPPTVGETGPAQHTEIHLQPAYRGWYVANAARRLTRNPLKLSDPVSSEYRFWFLHRAASDNRLRRSAQVDMTARMFGVNGVSAPILGWKAVMDDRTTAECRWANGRNFRADRRPPFGWPGTVHPRCRCRAVAPYPNAPLM